MKPKGKGDDPAFFINNDDVTMITITEDLNFNIADQEKSLFHLMMKKVERFFEKLKDILLRRGK